MALTVSRKSHFNAAHRLHVPSWSDEENRAYFGHCNLPNYHGHNYTVIATVGGEPDAVSGYLFDMKVLAQMMKEEIEDRFDHRNLNMDCAEFQSLNPTAENIAMVIWKLLRNRLPGQYSLKITLYETERNFVEYTG